MNKSILLLLAVLLLVLPLTNSTNCNEACIKSGYALGNCRESCTLNKNELSIAQTTDCAKIGQATLVIGTDALETYTDSNPYIDEDETDPDWVWVIKGLTTESSTDISSTSNAAQHTGPIIGIRNDFVANDIDQFDEKAKTINGKYCLPEDYICIKYNSSTISQADYGTYKIEYTIVDLSKFNSSWTSKPSVLIRSYDKDDGLKTQRANYNIVSSALTSDTTTDKIWIVYNNTGYAGIFYEDSSNIIRVAGYAQMNNADRNIADVNYYNTKDNDIQIDLRGDISAADNLNITLDISGNEGVVKDTDGIDDLVLWLSHAANGNFDGFGKSPSTSESAELTWGTTPLRIGDKDEDHLSLYGIQIINPSSNLASDQLLLEIPKDQVKAEIIIAGASKKSERGSTSTLVTGQKAASPILASELADLKSQNIIFVGGPCANPLVEKIEGFPNCQNWPYSSGESIIQISQIPNSNKIALLVAGTSAQDTQRASLVLKNYEAFKENIKGKIVKITGNSLEINNIKVEPLTKFSTKLDLSDYPVPFVEAGKFGNMLVVLGDEAKSKDTIGASYIISNLMSITKKASALNETITETEVTDAIKKDIPLGNALGDSGFFNNPVDNLESLQNTKIQFAGIDYKVKDVILLYNSGPSIKTSLSSGKDDYGIDPYMELEQGRLRYYYVFNQKIKLGDVTANNPVKIKFLDKHFKITKIKSATEFESQIANEYVMEVGSSKIISGKKVTLVNVGTDNAVMVKVDGAEEIIASGKRKMINGTEIENQAVFYENNQDCCCFDLLEYLK